METDDLRRLARNPAFIPGIFNYCDRWCERCDLSHRCMVHATEREMGEIEPGDIAGTMRAVADTFQLTIRMIQEDAAARGIDLDAAPDDQEFIEAERRHDERVDSDPLNARATQYMEAVGAWFKAQREALEGRMAELRDELASALPGRNPVHDADEINFAIDVIHWYQPQIAVKLMRAVPDEEEDLLDPRSDTNGSAKVALVGIDRSIEAWEKLSRLVPAAADTTLDLLARLQQLRQAVEKQYPLARSFIRPGFDEGAE